MATTLASDMKVYEVQVQSGLIETLVQNTTIFNEASRGAIRLIPVDRRGNYVQNAFIKSTSGLVSRRDNTSVAAATALKIQQDESVAVKVSRKIGPVDTARDAFLKAFGNDDAANAMLRLRGTQVAKAMVVEMADTALKAARVALNAQAAVKFTIASSGTMATPGLVSGLAKFGDASDRVVAWVMHSKQYFDLLADQIANYKIDTIAGFNIASATPVTLNRPVVLIDSPSLSSGATVPDYYCLGLTEGAITVEQTEAEYITLDEVTGLENIVVRLQGEYAYNVEVKGFKWDITNGGANPNDTAMGTATNWDVAASSYKDYGGILVQSR